MDSRKAAGTTAKPQNSSSSSSSKHGKSRPASLAQMHLAFLNHVERCRKKGTGVDFDPDAVRMIIQDQSGSKAHHAPHVRNPCEALDPLNYILVGSTACGAGTDPCVFRPDEQNFGVRMWPERRLMPFLRELQELQTAWAGGASSSPPAAVAEDVDMGVLDELRSQRAQTSYAPARPLW